MLNNFTLELKFNKPADISAELTEGSVFVLHSVFLQSGSNKGQLFLTVNGTKLVVANLSARRTMSKLRLRMAAEDGELKLSCSQGSSMVIHGFVEEMEDEHDHHHEGGCCDHEHAHEEISENEEEASTAADMMDLEADEASEDDEEEDDEEEDEEDDEEDEEEEEEEDDEEEDEEEEEEEEEIVVPTKKDEKKVTFNAKEQGPHKAAAKAEQAPLKPAIKQADQKPESKVGTTVTLKGGLKYTILKEGTGPVAASGRRVNVRYVGCLANNGRQFDKGQIKFRLGQGEVIKGWDMGVAGMRVRESRRLLIPAQLGYGSRGAPPAIPGNAALAFEVELLDLQ